MKKEIVSSLTNEAVYQLHYSKKIYLKNKKKQRKFVFIFVYVNFSSNRFSCLLLSKTKTKIFIELFLHVTPFSFTQAVLKLFLKTVFITFFLMFSLPIQNS